MQSDFMASSVLERTSAEKKQKLGIDDDTFQILSNSSISNSEQELDDEEREMTDEEYKIYNDVARASDGFDVPEFPGIYCCGMITPLVVNENTLKYLLPYSKAAIKVYNQNNDTDYEVVRVEKAMNQASCGINYYITFQAKSATAADDATKTIEASVLMGIPRSEGDDATKVLFCRDQGDRTVREEVSDDDEEDEVSDNDEEMEAQNGDGASVEIEGEGV